MIELIERFESFTSSVTKAYKSIQKIKIAEAEQIGLKPTHVMYMYYLGKNPEGLTHAELCKLCIEDKAAVSRAIVELTKKGFIKNSEENSNRKYRTKIVLTDEGKQINNNLNEAIAIAVNKASKNLDEVDRENFYRVFFYITDNLDEICSSYLKEK
ncbi:MAG: MarR family transcriptional regulator [Clostridium sp.]|jgi:DNA-binding MarR family transcriptional regulator|nr:MarR family transcriptional regulator [Romboutsia sp.]MBQ8998246.1 MarR family transcriptional regulator [Clostridium sp.]